MGRHSPVVSRTTASRNRRQRRAALASNASDSTFLRNLPVCFAWGVLPEDRRKIGLPHQARLIGVPQKMGNRLPAGTPKATRVYPRPATRGTMPSAASGPILPHTWRTMPAGETASRRASNSAGPSPPRCPVCLDGWQVGSALAGLFALESHATAVAALPGLTDIHSTENNWPPCQGGQPCRSASSARNSAPTGTDAPTVGWRAIQAAALQWRRAPGLPS